MPRAFVLINTMIGTMEDVLNELSQISSVSEAYMLYGVYDLVAVVETESMTKLREVVTGRIRQLDNVQSTQTLLVMTD